MANIYHIKQSYLPSLRLFVTIIFNFFAKVPTLLLYGFLFFFFQISVQQREQTCVTLSNICGGRHIFCLWSKNIFSFNEDFSNIKNIYQGKIKGTISKCTFLSLLEISGYWANYYLVVLGTCSKWSTCFRTFLNCSLGLDIIVLRLPETICQSNVSCFWYLPAPTAGSLIAVKRGRVPFGSCCQTLSTVMGYFPRRINESKHEYTD